MSSKIDPRFSKDRTKIKPSEKMQNGSSRPSSSSSKSSGSNSRISSKSSSNSNEKSVIEKSIKNDGLIIYGTGLPKRTYRANSLPGSSHRRPSLESGRPRSRHSKKSPSREQDCECRSAECLFHEHMSLDLSDLNDTEEEEEKRDKLSKQKSARTRRRSIEKSASTIKSLSSSPASKALTLTRRSSLQSFSPRSTYDSSCRTSSRKTGRKFSISHHPELIYSSNSPDNNTSTCDESPCKTSGRRSSVVARTCMTSSSSCYTSWMDGDRTLTSAMSMDANAGDTPAGERGEWDSFWHNYNLAAFPKKTFYDDCPTPFYDKSDTNKVDFELKNGFDGDNRSVKLSRDEAKEVIHCAHRLAEILTLALDKKNGMMETKSASTQVEEKLEVKRSITVETSSMRHALPLALELNKECNGISLVQKRGRLQESMSLQHDPKDVLL